jgi:hypothetical protein
VIRVKVIVEGPSEESFIKNVLGPTLWHKDIYLTPIVLGVPGHKGGNVKYSRVKRDILLQLKQDGTAFCSTMFDLYGLGEGFPGGSPNSALPGAQKAEFIEQNIQVDILAAVPDLRPDVRFLPYLQAHEYEALLFSDPTAFAGALGRDNLSGSFGAIRNSFSTPEDINDSPEAAPSRRVLKVFPSYKKVIEGTVAAQKVGIAAMRRECPHFNSWIEKIESLEAFL